MGQQNRKREQIKKEAELCFLFSCRNSVQVKKRGGTVNYEEKKSQDDEFLQRSSCKNEKKGEDISSD